MISARNLVKDFGARRAVDDVSFDVSKGEVLGFLGPNGAGKSTTMRMITGFITPTSGTTIVGGHDMATEPVEGRRFIGYLPENAPAYGDMTAREFLHFIASMRGYKGNEASTRVDEAMEKCFLTTVENQTIETMSKGYRQRTCFAQAILHDPPILILDEPTDGLDPNQKHVVRNMIHKMGKEKVIIFSTHVLEEVDAVCNRAIIISGGKIVADGTPEEIRRQSHTYNCVSILVAAEESEIKKELSSIADVARVETTVNGKNTIECRVFPKNQQPIAAKVFEKAHNQNWLVTKMETDGGQLDDVFRHLTATEDVDKAAQKED